MKVLFINDSTSQRNWGDRAAAVSLKAMIRAKGGEIVGTITEHDLTVSSFFRAPADPELGTQEAGKELLRPFIPPVLLQMRRKIVPDARRSRRSRMIPSKWSEYEDSAKEILGVGTPWPELVEMIETIDVAVIHGDGCMVANGVVPRTELFLAYLLKRHFRKPVIIVNHTADFDHPDLRRAAQEVYPLFDDVVFRDPVSEEKCRTICGGRFVPDTAFTFKPIRRETWLPVAQRPTFFDVWPDVAEFDPGRPYMCLGGSSIYGAVSSLERVTARYSLLIEHLRSLYLGQILLTASDYVDQEVFRPLAARLGLPMISVVTPTQQAVDILGNADAYIGGRWHPSIFALRGGAPIVILSAKTFKMGALAEMAGLPSVGFDALNPAGDVDALGRQLMSLLEQGSGLRTRLRTWAEEMAADSWGNVAYLDKWAVDKRDGEI